MTRPGERSGCGVGVPGPPPEHARADVAGDDVGSRVTSQTPTGRLATKIPAKNSASSAVAVSGSTCDT